MISETEKLNRMVTDEVGCMRNDEREYADHPTDEVSRLVEKSATGA